MSKEIPNVTQGPPFLEHRLLEDIRVDELSHKRPKKGR
jgi:hypothetical protein